MLSKHFFRRCCVVFLAVRSSHLTYQLCSKSETITTGIYSSFIGPRIMSQRSITSFFKITPKKESETKENQRTEETSPTTSPAAKNEVTPKTSPVSNKKVKAVAKRQRLDSTSSSSPSPDTQNTKKKPKRQRIESSGSEADVLSPPFDENKTQIKVEAEPKMYQSPKTKKTKLGKSPKGSETKVKAELSPVIEQSSPVNAQSSPENIGESKVKMEKVKSPLIEKNTKTSPKSGKKEQKITKTPSPKSGKKEQKNTKTTSPKSGKKEHMIENVTEKKEKKQAMSFFIRKENKEEERPAGGVPEEQYDPSLASYDPISDACWAQGQPVPYLALARTLQLIEGTSGRLKTISILANYLRSVIALSTDALVPSIYMCLNQLAPAYHSLELGVAETYLLKAVSGSTGCTVAQLRAAARKTGDLGAAAQDARDRQTTMITPKPLTVDKVFASLKEIAHMRGPSSVHSKISKIQTLYIACRREEAKYLIRSLEGKLRIGLAEQSVLQALAVAVTRTPPAPQGGAMLLDAAKGITTDQYKSELEQTALLIKSTYCECPNYELVVAALVRHGVKALPQHCRLTPGVPLKPMLAHPTRGVHDVFNRFENERFTCEFKYDGERTQLHVPECPQTNAPAFTLAGAFSRSQEPQAGKYPDVLKRLPALLKDSVTDCVLDAEAVAIDTNTMQILPFQVLSTRKRKEGDKEGEPTVRVCVFVFDLLYLNGRPLVREPLEERRRLLKEHFNEVPGEWQFAVSRDCSTEEEVQQFLEEAIKGSCEGLMVKTLTGDKAHYSIARRSRNWLKLKKDYLEGCGDSIDAVVIGAFLGRGKRAGRYGGFLLAARDQDADEYQSLCRIGTGFSDQQLDVFTQHLQQYVIDAPPSYYRFDQSQAPDVWLSAAVVWEVRCADLSLSPAHRAAMGLVQPDRGVSLRFPRFIRVRDDKSPESSTSARQIADMYLQQDQVKNNVNTTGTDKFADDDYY